MNWFRLLKFAGIFLFAIGALYTGLVVPAVRDALSTANPIGAAMSILFFGLLCLLLGLLAYLGYFLDFDKRRKTSRVTIKKCPVCKKSPIREMLFLKWFGLKEKAKYACRDCNTEFEKRKEHYALSKVRKSLMTNKVCKMFAGQLLYTREWENIADGYSDDVPSKRKGLDKENFFKRLQGIGGNVKITESRPGVVCIQQTHFWMSVHVCYFYRTDECVANAWGSDFAKMLTLLYSPTFYFIPGLIVTPIYFFFKRRRRKNLRDKIMKFASEV